MLEFRYLPAFLAVAETGNFTSASRRLHIAVSAVSRQIQLLEEACGVQLVFRSPQETKLSPAGQKLFEELRHFRAQAERIVDPQAVGNLRIGILQGVLRHWFVNLLCEAPLFKSMNLEIKAANPAELIGMVEAGDLDATFFSLVNLTQVPASLRIYRLFREEIVLISRHKMSLEEVDDHPWICFTAASWLVQYRRKDPTRYIIVNDLSVIVELVRRGQGIAMVPSYVLSDVRNLHIQPVKKFSKEYIFLVTRAYDREPPSLTALCDLLQKHSPDWKQIQ
jgi:DNA-binding transcriptional LysR family regulator